MKRDLTIVIPCYNEELYIGRTLMEICRQIGVKGVRVIVSDGGSTDRTREIVEEVSRNLGLMAEIIEGGSVSRGRNSGAELVQTPYILFIDADVAFPSKSSIYQAYLRIKSKNLDLVSTTPVYEGERDWRARVMFWLNRHASTYLSQRFPFAIGAFTLVRKDVFDSLGGYDERAKHTEDWLFSKQIRVSKFSLVHGLITQDNRRFKRYGYLRMIGLMMVNFLHRNRPEHFYREAGYWD
jgi:glycosyltransferase involved in cell wall biosynthesis